VLDARLLRTTTFRVALVYLGLFLLSVSAILGVVYGMTAGLLDRQTQETIEAELEGLQEHYARRGLPGLAQILRERSSTPRTPAIYLLTDRALRPVVGNLASWPEGAHADGWIAFDVANPEDGGTQPARAVVLTLPDGGRLLVGRDLGERERIRDRTTEALLWALGLTLGLGVLGGVAISRNFMHRIEAINRTTLQIMTGDLHSRIPAAGGGDELDRLAGNLNGMLDQIERLMAGMRHVSEGVAHDLRTPLSRLRARLELALIGSEDLDAARGAMQDALAEADRLLATFQALLSIAEAEAGYRETPLAPVELAEVARTAIDLYEPLAEEKGIALEADLVAGVAVRGHEQLLAQAAVNLLDNAVKYTPEGGRIRVSVGLAGEGEPVLEVADSGPGIPPEDRERVLARFVRLERSRTTPGNGLGLSLVDAVARLHSARLSMEDGGRAEAGGPGGSGGPGLRVCLRFPPPAP
jgi:signal transduction histidine kinase